jgi:hypothetical protein
MAAFQSARGLAHSKTLRVHQAASNFRQVLAALRHFSMPDDDATKRRQRHFTA